MVNPVRKVIIETEIRHTEGRGGRSVGGSSSSGKAPIGSARNEKSITSEKKQQVALDSKGRQITMRDIKARQVFIAREKKWELQKLKIRENSAKMEEQRIRAMTKGELYLQRIRKNSERMQRNRTKEIMSTARRQDSFELSPEAQRVRREAERRINYRRDTKQPINIGGFKEKGTDSRSVNPFATGMPAIDDFNAKGFQLFITVMSAKMAFNAGTVAVDNATGLFTGRGDSLGAQANRFYETGAVQEGSWLQRMGQIGNRAQETLASGVMRLYGVQNRDLIMDRMRQRGDFDTFGSGAPGRMTRRPAAQRRLADARIRAQGMEGMSSYIKELRSLHEAQTADERELLNKRLQATREELSYLRQRTGLFRSEYHSALAERDQAVLAFGGLDAPGKKRARGIRSYLDAGGDAGRLPREDQEFMLSNQALFGRDIRSHRANNAFKSGFQEDFGGFFKQFIESTFQDLARAGRDAGQMRAEERSIEATIENLTFEVKYEELEENFKKAMLDVNAQLIRALKDAAEEDARKKRLGQDGGP